MSQCPTCGQPIKGVDGERKFIKIPSPDAFRTLCNLVLQSPNCTDEKFISALQDLPKAAHKYGQLTEGQWKFFCAIYKNVLNTWPPKPEAIVDAHAASMDVNGIPF